MTDKTPDISPLFGIPSIPVPDVVSGLSQSDVNGIVTVIGVILRTLGIGALADFLGFLLKIEQAWAASNGTPLITSQPPNVKT